MNLPPAYNWLGTFDICRQMNSVTLWSVAWLRTPPYKASRIPFMILTSQLVNKNGTRALSMKRRGLGRTSSPSPPTLREPSRRLWSIKICMCSWRLFPLPVLAAAVQHSPATPQRLLQLQNDFDQGERQAGLPTTRPGPHAGQDRREQDQKDV